jgi:outer membrane lipoprotein carrier protein
MRSMLVLGLLFLSSAKIIPQDKELTVDFVTENLQKRYEMIDDATAQFEQHVKYGYSNIEQTFQGTLLMKKPNRYRLESEHQTIVTDGVTVWSYSSANNQVIINKYIENSSSLSPEQFLLNLPAHYYTSLLGSEKSMTGTIVLLKLVPKDDRSFIKSVKLSIEEHGWLVRKIVILDVNDTETTYTIKDMKLNTDIKEKAFIFEKPEGAEIVDLR